MKKSIFPKLLWITLPIFSTMYQVFMKMIARTMEDMPFGILWIEKVVKTPLILVVLFSEIMSFVIWMQILAKHDLSKAFPISGINYVLILSAGWFIFNEPIMPLQIMGSVLIVIGVCLIGAAPSMAKPKQ